MAVQAGGPWEKVETLPSRSCWGGRGLGGLVVRGVRRGVEGPGPAAGPDGGTGGGALGTVGDAAVAFVLGEAEAGALDDAEYAAAVAGAGPARATMPGVSERGAVLLRLDGPISSVFIGAGPAD